VNKLIFIILFFSLQYAYGAENNNRLKNIDIVSTTFTGNQMLENASAYLAMQNINSVNSVTQTKALYFVGYVNAIIDSDKLIKIWYKTESYCTDNTITMEQLQSVVAKYIIDNPQERNLPTYIMAINALKKAFPC